MQENLKVGTEAESKTSLATLLVTTKTGFKTLEMINQPTGLNFSILVPFIGLKMKPKSHMVIQLPSGFNLGFSMQQEYTLPDNKV